MLLCVILNHLVLPLLINKRLTQGIPASHRVYHKTHDVYILQKVTSIYIRFNIKHLAQNKSSLNIYVKYISGAIKREKLLINGDGKIYIE